MTDAPATGAAAAASPIPVDPAAPGRAVWLAFVTLCAGDLLIVLDSTIVNVALPTIRTSLGFAETELVWVVNAFLLTFGGFLLLGGRLADLFGPRRLFIYGTIGFTLASLACGLAVSKEMLIVARAAQGLSGAVVSAVALSLIMRLFPDGPHRVRAMGYFGFVMAGGGSVGVLLGGLLTALDWRTIFLVNLPIGAAVVIAALRLLPPDEKTAQAPKLDIAGAVTITLALLMAVYGVVGAEIVGFAHPQTIALLIGAGLLLALFVWVEARAKEPLVPLALLARRNIYVANMVAGLWAAAMFAWFFLSALYMQRVLGYGPLLVGLAFLPANLIMGAFSYSLSAQLVNRFGVRLPLACGLAFAAAGLLWFSFAPVDGRFWLHIFPPMALLGIGAGMALNPMLLAAMSDAPEADSGLASGIVNTAFMMGGSLGLAILATLAASTARGVGGEGAAAATAGYSAAFLAGAGAAAAAAILGWTAIRERPLPAGAAAH